MSKFRTAALGAVVFLGMAASAAAQAPVTADSARRIDEGGPRREHVEGQRKMRMERGMRRGDARMERGMRHRGVRQGAMRKGGAEGRMRGREFARGMLAGHGMAQLNLTEAQRTQVRAIHEKYQPQFRTLREQSQPQMRAMMDARHKGDTSAATRQRFQQQREQIRARSQALQRQQQNEVRGILTPEQRSKVDAAREVQARRMEEQARALQEQARQLRAR